MSLTASKGDLLVLVDDDGRAAAYPKDRLPDIVEILKTPATIKVSTVTGPVIADGLRELQPGEPGHARASLIAAGFDVTES